MKIKKGKMSRLYNQKIKFKMWFSKTKTFFKLKLMKMCKQIFKMKSKISITISKMNSKKILKLKKETLSTKKIIYNKIL